MSNDLFDYVAGLSQMLQDLDFLAHAPEGGLIWQNLVDLDAVPDEGLPWLGQWVGARLNLTLTGQQQRQQIRDHTGWGRGSVPTFKAEIRPYLTGTQTVDITERSSSAYTFVINTYADETPNETAVRALINGQGPYEITPGGLQPTYTVLPGSPAPLLYSDLKARGYTYADMKRLFETYADIR